MNTLTTKAFVYLLIDCSNGEPYYVGFTHNPEKRFYQHTHEYPKHHKDGGSGTRESRRILKEGGNVFMLVAYSGCIMMCAQMEVFFMKLLRNAGVPLVNKCRGGISKTEKPTGKAVIHIKSGELFVSFADAARFMNCSPTLIKDLINRREVFRYA